MRLCTLPKSRVPTSLLCTRLLQIHLLSLAASYAEEQRRTLLVLEEDKWCVDTDMNCGAAAIEKNVASIPSGAICAASVDVLGDQSTSPTV